MIKRTNNSDSVMLNQLPGGGCDTVASRFSSKINNH